MSLVAGLPGWAHALVVLGAVAAVLLGGRLYLTSGNRDRIARLSRLQDNGDAAPLPDQVTQN